MDPGTACTLMVRWTHMKYGKPGSLTISMRLTLVYKAILSLPTGGTEDADFAIKNWRAYAELVQVLDDWSLQLIINDSDSEGRKALQTLRQHYASTEKNTHYDVILGINIYCNDRETEDVTGYLICAIKAATGLRSVGETLSHNLIITMLLKGLPASFNSLVVVQTQTDSVKTLAEFKAALRNHANTEAIRTSTQTTAMASKSYKHYAKPPHRTFSNKTSTCLSCGQTGHTSQDCRVK